MSKKIISLNVDGFDKVESKVKEAEKLINQLTVMLFELNKTEITITVKS